MAGRGTGVPNWFRCSRCRSLFRYSDYSTKNGYIGSVELTGRTRPYNTGNLPHRSTNVKREYRCNCGHVGWSNHVDLERKAAK